MSHLTIDKDKDHQQDVSRGRIHISKSRVTTTYKLVTCVLVQSVEQSFVLEDSDRAGLKDKHSILRRNFNEIQVIHKLSSTSGHL